MIKIKIDIRKAAQLAGDNSLFISFPFDSRLVDTVRSFPIKFWHGMVKEWELPFNKLGEFINKVQDYEVEINAEQYISLEAKKAEMPKGFEFKTKPFEHQIDGFNYGLTHDRWLLADEQGLGKTKQVIDIAVAKKLQHDCKHCLIICGVNGLKYNWMNEIQTHSNETGYILGTRGNKIGSNKDKLADLTALPASNTYFIITNIESIRDEQINAKIKELCVSGDIGVIAVDEIHKCFDYDTLITTDIGTLKIGDIVKDQISCSVLSYNETTGENEWKRIVDWHENVVAEQLLELQFETESGIKTVKCTKGHKFFTKNRGWVRAEDLTSYDDIQEF